MPKILIVDSDPVQRLLIREILNEDPSLTFLEASSSTHALRLTHRYRPQTIILDIRLPGFDEFKFYHQVSSAPDVRHIPLILTTAGLQSDPTFKLFKATGHPLLVKPFEPGDLQAAVNQAFLRAGVPSQVS